MKQNCPITTVRGSSYDITTKLSICRACQDEAILNHEPRCSEGDAMLQEFNRQIQNEKATKKRLVDFLIKTQQELTQKPTNDTKEQILKSLKRLDAEVDDLKTQTEAVNNKLDKGLEILKRLGY